MQNLHGLVLKTQKSSKMFIHLLPYQFELLQKVFEAIREHGMTEGKHLISK